MYFEDFTPGNTFESKPRTITQEDIGMFAELTGDLNPLHLSDEYASKTIYGRRIAHGLLTLGVALGEWFDLGLTRESVVAFLGMNNLTFRAPVFAGDSVGLRTEVLSVKSSESRPDVGIVTFKDQVSNGDGKLVLQFERTLMLRKKNQ